MKECTLIADSTAMVFNLTTRYSKQCSNHKWGIHTGEIRGPEFGNGDLRADESFNEGNSCSSSVNEVGYLIDLEN